MNDKNFLFACFLMIAANTYAQQIDMSLIPYRQGDKWGFASPDKHIVIAPKYNEVSWFSEGYASVKVGNKYGYINKAGRLVIPAKFTVAKSFRKGYMPTPGKTGGDSVLFAGASLNSSGYEICINTKGARMPKCPAINENSVPENKIPVQTVIRQKTYSLPNNGGLFDKIVDDYKISGNDETYYVAMKNNMYGVFNSKFDTIVPFQYNNIKVVMSGNSPYLEVNKDGMYGIANSSGQMVILPENTKVVTIDGKDGIEYVIVQRGGKTYVKDINNKDIISNGYSDIIYDDAGGFIITGDDNMRGYYFADNTVIQPRYLDVKLVNGTRYLIVKTSAGKVGYISSTGNEYFVE